MLKRLRERHLGCLVLAEVQAHPAQIDPCLVQGVVGVERLQFGDRPLELLLDLDPRPGPLRPAHEEHRDQSRAPLEHPIVPRAREPDRVGGDLLAASVVARLLERLPENDERRSFLGPTVGEERGRALEQVDRSTRVVSNRGLLSGSGEPFARALGK